MLPPTPDQKILQQGPQMPQPGPMPNQGSLPVQPTQPAQQPSIPQQPPIDPEIQAQIDQQKQAQEEEIDDKVNKLLLQLMKEAEKDDEQVRYRLVQTWKRNNYYFNNLQRFFFDDVARDYRTIDSAVAEMEKYGPVSDLKTINVYRAYAESIIAVLSVATPNVEFFPDDAENPEDVATADAYSRIAELIKRHNAANLMLIKALTTLYNQGVVCAYNYYERNPDYGVTRVPKDTKQIEQKTFDLRCPNCSEMVDSGLPQSFVAAEAQIVCPNCGYKGAPHVYPRLEYTTETVSWEETPKGRTRLDFFGPTYVKLPLNARDQSACGYLILRLDDDIAKFKSTYTDHADDISSGGGDTYRYERWGRIPPEYFGTMPININTLRVGWFRPWYYRRLSTEDAEFLESIFPNGVKVDVIDDLILEKHHEGMDDKWTLSFDPRSEFVHSEPAGNCVIPIQDATNDLFNIGLQSIEYGIPETFVHPKTLNLEKYSEGQSTPGMMTAALPPGPDKGLADGFHTIKAATLSNEYTNFDSSLSTKGQFVSGAIPSIFGGNTNVGSKTADEYNTSQAAAKQRLQIVWEMASVFWARMMGKAVTMFATNLMEDEKYTDKKNGTYVNVWIQKSQLAGKVGHVEPEVNGQLPQSWAQKKDFIIQLITMAGEAKDPTLGQILLDPNNTEMLKTATGMPEFYIPGEEDRNKQYAEYYKMSVTGQMVPIDVVVDDHGVHMKVLKNILVSMLGTTLYDTNPTAYQACISHYRQHELAQQAKTMAASGMTAPGQPAESAAQSVQG